jgi:hypothetical protein
VRSSKCGQTERNFRFNSDNVFTSAKLNARTPRLIPLFIYSALVVFALHPSFRSPWCDQLAPGQAGAWLTRNL